jgi:hypothetical protein
MSGIFDGFGSGTDTKVSGSSSAKSKSVLAIGGRGEDLAAGEILPEERDRVSAIQRQLAQETLFRNRNYGLRSLLGAFGGGKTSLLGSG